MTDPAPSPSPTPSTLPVGLQTTLNVGENWWHGLRDAVSPPAPPPGSPPPAPQTKAQDAVHTLRRVQTVVASAVGALGLIKNTLDVGFAELTSPIAALFPALPAATLSMPYLGVPHTHTHPPSLIPPAPPIPLPSIGVIMFGTCVRVPINGMPAARAGDLGIAPTCGGLAPYFEITTGSSNVFIGGARAARVLDICKVCTPAPAEATGAAKMFSSFMTAAGFAVAGTDMAVDIGEAAVEDDAAVASAKALAAAMTALQIANDAIRLAMSALMGMDPGMPNLGAVMAGQPNVLIGGFPMVNIPNPIDWLIGKLGRLKGKVEPEEEEPETAGGSGHC